MKRTLLPIAIVGAAVVISIAMNLLKPAPVKAENPYIAENPSGSISGISGHSCRTHTHITGF